ncbi:MAG: hypothetical protein ABI905_10830 [Betaproteobacteria bacterium]
MKLLVMAVAMAVTASHSAPAHAAGPPAAPSAPAAPSPSPPATQAPYVDRVMQDVLPDNSEVEVREYSSEGMPRGISLQFTRNLQTSKNSSASAANTRIDTQGLQLDAFIETPNFGALSLHALALGGNRTTGLTSWSVRQTGLPFDGGWLVDNALGTTNLVIPELARRNSRLALPSPQVLGGSSVWRNEGVNGIVVGGSAGEPGRFEGFPQSRFVGSGGEVASVFAQSTRGPWTAAAVVAQGHNVLPEVAVDDDNARRINPRGFYISAARNESVNGISWQGSALASSSAGTDATGLWGDATWHDGGGRHQVSLFRFTEGLTWIDRPLPTDLQGGSYRFDYNSLRWDLSANVEAFKSVSGLNPDGWFASSSARWLHNSKLSSGGGFAVRNFGVTGASVFGYMQMSNSLGVTRAQLDVASTQGGERSQTATIDHSMYTDTGMSLSTTLSLERLRPVNSVAATVDTGTSVGIVTTPRYENAVELGLNGRAPLTTSLSLQGSLRARRVSEKSGHGAGNQNSGTTVAATAGVDWQISRDWSFGASLYVNRGVLVDAVLIESPLVIPDTVRVRPSDRGFFITLRYGSHAGTATVPMGGAPGTGSGRIEGTLYLDANGNGARDGNENGAANVLILLDGKFSTRTNAFGGFEFAPVVSGPHTLTVLQDDLPLPWSVDAEQKISAQVSTRGTTRVDIGARRPR